MSRHPTLTRQIEGVTYYPFVIRFRLKSGRRKRWVRWSPAEMFVRSEVARELQDTIGIDAVKPGSLTIEAA